MAKGKGRPLATKQQIRLAEKGIGRITKFGRYQSPREIASRAVREQRRQLKRLVGRYETQYQSLSKTGYYNENKEAERYTKEAISNAREKLKSLYNMPSEKRFIESERRKQGIEKTGNKKGKKTPQEKAADTMAKKRYTAYLKSQADKASEQSSYLKTQTIKSVGTKQGRYKAHEKRLWSAIFAYTYGDKKMGGLWESGEEPDEDTVRKNRKAKRHTAEYDGRKQAIYDFVQKEIGLTEPPTDTDVFMFFENVIGSQYSSGTVYARGDEYDSYGFSLIDYILSPDYDERYSQIVGGVIDYTRK